MEINKLYIIGINEDKLIKVCKELQNINNDFVIANHFTTSQSYADIDSSDKYIYYISEDQLNLDFKNNSLLFVLTDSETQESKGIAIEEYDNSQLIPIHIKSFNTIKKKFLENTLIIWIDSKIKKSNYSNIDYQINMIESKYLMKNIDGFKNQFLYFCPNEEIKDIVFLINEFLNANDEIREKILEENN